jgi:hypothetical protein
MGKAATLAEWVYAGLRFETRDWSAELRKTSEVNLPKIALLDNGVAHTGSVASEASAQNAAASKAVGSTVGVSNGSASSLDQMLSGLRDAKVMGQDGVRPSYASDNHSAAKVLVESGGSFAPTSSTMLLVTPVAPVQTPVVVEVAVEPTLAEPVVEVVAEPVVVAPVAPVQTPVVVDVAVEPTLAETVVEVVAEPVVVAPVVLVQTPAVVEVVAKPAIAEPVVEVVAEPVVVAPVVLVQTPVVVEVPAVPTLVEPVVEVVAEPVVVAPVAPVQTPVVVEVAVEPSLAETVVEVVAEPVVVAPVVLVQTPAVVEVVAKPAIAETVVEVVAEPEIIYNGLDCGRRYFNGFDSSNTKIVIQSNHFTNFEVLIAEANLYQDEASTVLELHNGLDFIILTQFALGDLTADMFFFEPVGDVTSGEPVFTRELFIEAPDLPVVTQGDVFNFGLGSGTLYVTDFDANHDHIFIKADLFDSFEAMMSRVTVYQEASSTVFELHDGADMIIIPHFSTKDVNADMFVFEAASNERDTAVIEIELGTDQDDTLIFGAGNQMIDPGLGFDVVTGGEGQDTFVFGATSGHDFIIDFKAGEDLIQISADLATGFDHLLDTAAIYQDGGATQIEFAGGQMVTLYATNAQQASADWFSFS